MGAVVWPCPGDWGARGAAGRRALNWKRAQGRVGRGVWRPHQAPSPTPRTHAARAPRAWGDAWRDGRGARAEVRQNTPGDRPPDPRSGCATGPGTVAGRSAWHRDMKIFCEKKVAEMTEKKQKKFFMFLGRSRKKIFFGPPDPREVVGRVRDGWGSGSGEVYSDPPDDPPDPPKERTKHAPFDPQRTPLACTVRPPRPPKKSTISRHHRIHIHCRIFSCRQRPGLAPSPRTQNTPPHGPRRHPILGVRQTLAAGFTFRKKQKCGGCISPPRGRPALPYFFRERGGRAGQDAPGLARRAGVATRTSCSGRTVNPRPRYI